MQWYIQIRLYTCNICNTYNTDNTYRYMQIHKMHAIHSIHAIHADTFRYILMLMIHVHTYIIHATYMLYIQIHSNIYTSLLHCDVAVILLCMYVFVCIACMQSDTHRYIHIHVHTCSYIHIHTHTYPPQSVAWRGFGVLLLPHATPMRSSTYPDLLGRGSGWDGAALSLPYACRAHGRAKTGLGMCPWSLDKVAGLLPMAVLSGTRSLPPPPGDVSGLLWAPTHKRVYVACMWPTYRYMYTHVHTCIQIHAIRTHMDWFQNLQM